MLKRLIVVCITMCLMLNTLSLVYASVPSSFSVTGRKNETIIYNWLKDTMGCNTAVACGVLANIEKESNFNPEAINPNDKGATSFGICQWRAERFTALKNHCSKKGLDYRSLDGQLSYLQYELSTSEKSAWKLVKNNENNADGAYWAGFYWAKKFERCESKNGDEAYENRGKLAKEKYWSAYGTEPVPPKYEIDSRFSSYLPIKTYAISSGQISVYE